MSVWIWNWNLRVRDRGEEEGKGKKNLVYGIYAWFNVWIRPCFWGLNVVVFLLGKGVSEFGEDLGGEIKSWGISEVAAWTADVDTGAGGATRLRRLRNRHSLKSLQTNTCSRRLTQLNTPTLTLPSTISTRVSIPRRLQRCRYRCRLRTTITTAVDLRRTWTLPTQILWLGGTLVVLLFLPMPHTLSTRRLLPFAMMLISRRRLCDSSLMRNTLGASLLPSHSMPRFQGGICLPWILLKFHALCFNWD